MNKQEVIKVMKEIKDEMYLVFTTVYEEGYNKGLDTAITYIEKLIDPEKPVVPQFIDTWIQGAKYNGFDLYEAMTDDEMSDKVATWIVCNSEIFAKAWIYGYEVQKKEKLYTAQLKSTGEFLHYDKETDKVHHFCAYGNTARNSKNYHFTEDTLIQYNAWGNDAYDVNEVEE